MSNRAADSEMYIRVEDVKTLALSALEPTTLNYRNSTTEVVRFV
jgi:hypothetical protein